MQKSTTSTRSPRNEQTKKEKEKNEVKNDLHACVGAEYRVNDLACDLYRTENES